MKDGMNQDSELELESTPARPAGRTAAPAPSTARKPGTGTPPRRRKPTWQAAVFLSILNMATVVLIIYLTYFFTTYFSSRPGSPGPVSPADAAARRQSDELRTRDRELLSSYGAANPPISNLRIPVRRAMELVVTESAAPVPAPAPAPAAVAAPAAAPASAPAAVPQTASVATAPTAAAPAAPATPPLAAPASSSATAPTAPLASASAPPAGPAAAPPSAPQPAPSPHPTQVGMAPNQLYRAICIVCHDTDGRGTIIRKVLPQIPDFTDPKWQLTRTDADLQHSVLEGKGQFMLPMKDKLALAHTDVKDLIAFVRGFGGGKQVVGPAVGPQLAANAAGQAIPGLAPPVLPVPAAPAVPPAPVAAPAAPAPSASTTALPPTALPPTALPPTALPPTALPTAASTPTASSAPTAAWVPEPATLTAAPTAPEAVTTVPAGSPPSAQPEPALSQATPAASPAPTVTLPTLPLPIPSERQPALTASAAPSAGKQARLKVAGDVFRANCMVCHGPDGRGTAIRLVMPPLPDFTNGDWQRGHTNPQLVASVLNGKGTYMPAWQGRISPQQASELAEYVRSFGPERLVATSAPAGAFTTRFNTLSQQWDQLENQLNSEPAR